MQSAVIEGNVLDVKTKTANHFSKPVKLLSVHIFRLYKQHGGCGGRFVCLHAKKIEIFSAYATLDFLFLPYCMLKDKGLRNALQRLQSPSASKKDQVCSE